MSKQQAAEDINAIKHEAAIMYIKHGHTLREVGDKLNVSKSTVQKWSEEGKWQDLRQDITYDRKEAERHEAAVLYIKNGLSAKAISQQLNVSMPTLQKWNKAGRWQELRPDMDTLNQHKAAGLYIDKGMNESEIAEKLSIPLTVIKIWVDLYGWNGAKLIRQSENITVDITNDFRRHFVSLFPALSIEIQVAQNDYIKNMKPKI